MDTAAKPLGTAKRGSGSFSWGLERGVSQLLELWKAALTVRIYKGYLQRVVVQWHA